MVVIAPDEMPKVIPPIAKKPTKNKTLNKLSGMFKELEIPAKTPPSIPFFVSLVIKYILFFNKGNLNFIK